MEGKPSAVTEQALAWLDARPEPPPPDLRQRMAEALASVTAETVPGALAEGALACLQTTMAAPQERATALDLLAADALLTYALEAASEISAAALQELAQAYGPNALADLLAAEAQADTGASGHGDAGATTTGTGVGGDVVPGGGTLPGDGAPSGEETSPGHPRNPGEATSSGEGA